MIVEASELTDVSLDLPNSHIVIEMPNGQRMATNSYRLDTSARGEPIVVLMAGRKLNKKRSK